MFFKNFKVWETEFAGRKLSVETGKMARTCKCVCNGSLRRHKRALHRYGFGKAREGVDFFPLSVDYEEKMYSVGRIPGSFQRREAEQAKRRFSHQDV